MTADEELALLRVRLADQDKELKRLTRRVHDLESKCWYRNRCYVTCADIEKPEPEPEIVRMTGLRQVKE